MLKMLRKNVANEEKLKLILNHILTRSDVDKTRSLLEGIQKEVELDGQHPTPEQDIAIRCG